MNKQFYVYILGSSRPTLYIGVTTNLAKRTWEHKTGVADSFTQKYAIHNLLNFEIHDSAESAITREKQLKKWKREWKMRLIQSQNPTLEDLSDSITF